jgi:small subunit ribosomal protein S6
MAMAFYETVFIARQDISAKQTEELAKYFGDIINKNGGALKKTENWGLRTLAYKINKSKKGHYVMFQFAGTGATVAELERLMKINEDVVRYMTVSIEKLTEGQSIMMRQDDHRDFDQELEGEAA